MGADIALKPDNHTKNSLVCLKNANGQNDVNDHFIIQYVTLHNAISKILHNERNILTH